MPGLFFCAMRIRESEVLGQAGSQACPNTVALGLRIGEGTFLSPWFLVLACGDKNVPSPLGQAAWPSAVGDLYPVFRLSDGSVKSAEIGGCLLGKEVALGLYVSLRLAFNRVGQFPKPPDEHDEYDEIHGL